MLVDDFPKGHLADYHKYREKNFKHAYYCPECIRVLESVMPMEKCSFCGSNLRELSQTEDALKEGAAKFRYYCPKCELYSMSDKKTGKCSRCDSKLMELYAWRRLGRGEKFSIRFAKLKKILKVKKKSSDKNK